jgi:serine protease Do
MRMPHKLIYSFALVGCLLFPGRSQAQFYKDQSGAYLRTNPTFLKSFREVVAKPSESTVRIQCDGKDTALGMIVGPDGWILTKANDLKGDITVKLRDGKTFDARWVGVQQQNDVAILKIEATGLKPIEFTDSKKAGVGNWVACAGIGDDPVGIGVVSVATRVIPKGNMGFAPVADLSKSGYLGVELEQGDGRPRITNVQESTPAAKIGLKKNDLILALNGAEMKDMEQFRMEIGKHKPGEEVTLKVQRGDVELELKPKLDRRPLGSNRNEQQNQMGSELSKRRGGYPSILQHDSVVKPTDCGGPVVDLDGKVIGINICRAGRVESWAVPAEAIQPLLFDLMAGKLPPKREVATLTPEKQVESTRKALKKAEENKTQAEKTVTDLKTALAKLEDAAKAAAAKAATAKATETAKDNAKPMPGVNPPSQTKNDEALAQSERLVNLMQQRLKLMKDVASAKWQAKQTGADPKREQELLDQLVEQGKKLGLSADVVRGFFNAQFDAAKQIQQSFFDTFQKDKVELKNVPDLQKDLRPKLDQVSQDLLATFAQLQPHLANPAVQQRLRDRAAALLAGDGITDAVRNRALEPLVKK